MARCERGYVCVVCGLEVEELAQSALSLRYLLGDVTAEELHRVPECHLACDVALSQYIVEPNFPPVVCGGLLDRRTLDAEFVRGEVERVTRAWQQLQQIAASGGALLAHLCSEGGPN